MTEEKQTKKKPRSENSIDLGFVDMKDITARNTENKFLDFVNRLGFYQSNGLEIPSYSTQSSAGMDLRADLSTVESVDAYDSSNSKKQLPIVTSGEGTKWVYLHPGERALIPTGLYADIPDAFWLGIYARSGTSWKQGLLITNGVGVIDSDYVEEIKVSITNNSGTLVRIESGERIAQAVIHPRVVLDINVLSEKPKVKTDRISGFGSTGNK